MINTLKFTYSLLFFLSFSGLSKGQVIPVESEKEPLRAGLRIGMDLAHYVFEAIEPSITGFEAMVDYEVKENWFIVLEGGFQNAIPQNENYDYKLKGWYARAGFNYDLLKNTDDLDIFFVGLRYGQSHYTQSAQNIELTNYWGNTMISLNDENLTAHWIEAVVGMKAELFFLKNLFIGWTLRGKVFAGGNDYENLAPYTIPGYAREEKATLGITWSLSYNIPFRKTEL